MNVKYMTIGEREDAIEREYDREIARINSKVVTYKREVQRRRAAKKKQKSLASLHALAKYEGDWKPLYDAWKSQEDESAQAAIDYTIYLLENIALGNRGIEKRWKDAVKDIKDMDIPDMKDEEYLLKFIDNLSKKRLAERETDKRSVKEKIKSMFVPSLKKHLIRTKKTVSGKKKKYRIKSE